tara:strand:- start:75 stop:281 length:207 start_codon:yes stop_codon:yes gene_type:complete
MKKQIIKSFINEALKYHHEWISFENTELMTDLITYLVNLKILKINSNYTKVKINKHNAILFLDNDCKI